MWLFKSLSYNVRLHPPPTLPSLPALVIPTGDAVSAAQRRDLYFLLVFSGEVVATEDLRF